MNDPSNPALGPLIEMALEDPPYLEGKLPCLLYVSTSHMETQQTFKDDISNTMIGKLVDDTTFTTRNGWTIVFKHSLDREEIRTFELSIKERNDYQIVETWTEVALLRKDDLPMLIDAIYRLDRMQTRH